jgi:hypothetical protein
MAGNDNKNPVARAGRARDGQAIRYTEPTSYPRPVLEVLGQVALKAGKAQVLRNFPSGAGTIS